MYRNILVPIALDHERDTTGAIALARHLVTGDGKITVLHVLEAMPGYVAQYMPPGHDETRHSEAMAALRAETAGAPDLKTAIVTGHAGRSILDYSAEQGTDCIVMASHRPGLQDYLLGSTAARVVRHATCAVHVLR